MTKIREIFTSIQGEGPLIGYKQLFIRLCGCNLSCKYCDTDFDVKNSREYSLEEILEIINKHKDCHSISLTGGEPLLNTVFIKKLAQQTDLPLFLETNGTLIDNLREVIDIVEFISADIKLPSCSGIEPSFETFDKFLSIAKQKYTFAKAVFDNNITTDEIYQISSICKKHNIELILQPMMSDNKPVVSSTFMLKVQEQCLEIYGKVRLIPQVHKFIDII